MSKENRKKVQKKYCDKFIKKLHQEFNYEVIMCQKEK